MRTGLFPWSTGPAPKSRRSPTATTVLPATSVSVPSVSFFVYGLVQLYRNSLAARALLARWHRTFAAFPGCADDACLNFVFNNLTSPSWLGWVPKRRWLPKSYGRISWWIYEKPVINYTARPSSAGGLKSSFIRIKDPPGREEFSRSLVQPRQASFPQGCIIDTERHMLCRFVNGKTCLGRADKTDLLGLKRLIPPARWGASSRSGALMSSEKAETTAEKSISDSAFQVSWDRCKNKRHS